MSKIIGTTIYTPAAHEVFNKDVKSSYNNLTDKPKINGVELVGDKSFEDLGISGVEGAVGGYYTPIVNQTSDNEVEVSFTASNEDMETVSPVSIALPAGPQGDSGVYLGASEPVDESVNVWINPEEYDDLYSLVVSPTKAEVGQTIVVKEVDDKGRPVSWEYVDMTNTEVDHEAIEDAVEKYLTKNPPAGGGECSFHATATADGTTHTYVFSEDENGNPMSLNEVWIRTKYTGDTGYLITKINGTQISYRHATKTGYYESQYYTRFGDSVYGIISVTTDGDVSGMNIGFKGGGIAANLLNGRKIESVSVGGTNLAPPAGTTIEVFGR
jgi:hypothetical protein